jgi:tetratricopeptide (TPR) repeat protein
LNGKGNALVKMNRYQDAIKCYDDALFIDPKFKHSHNGKGDALKRLNRYDDALKSFD